MGRTSNQLTESILSVPLCTARSNLEPSNCSGPIRAMYLFLQLVCYVIGMRIAADGYRIVKTIQSANRIFAVERLKSSTRSMNLRTDSFGENAVFGKNFRSAWENLVTAVVSNDRKLYLVTDFDHTLTTFASKQCHDIIALHDEYPKEFHQEYRDICSMEFAAGEFHKWWRIAHDLIVDRSGLTEEMFERGIKSAGIQLRPGTHKFHRAFSC